MIISRAIHDAVITHRASASPMGPGYRFGWEMTTVAGELALVVIPGEQMTWARWILVLAGLRNFMRDFEYVELYFIVISIPMGPIAHGSIALGEHDGP